MVRQWLLWRDILLFLGGLSGVAHETLAEKAQRPDLLVVFTGMMGFPVFLAGDRKRNRDEEEDR